MHRSSKVALHKEWFEQTTSVQGKAVATIRVLCYHSNNISGNDYANNDHVALAEDIKLLHALGIPIVPLSMIVAGLGSEEVFSSPAVALSCDDGTWFDWHDVDHPKFGPQTSFRNILERERPHQPDLQMTSFVIASPEARTHLDQTCLVGLGWMGEDWWAAAEHSGVITIENHSWDHNHDSLAPAVDFPEVSRGGFRQIDSERIADFQIRQAQRYLNKFRSSRPGLFGYPYGEYNDYLAEEYFPRFGAEIGIAAAFTTDPAPITPTSNRWRLPRYVCGWHWKSPEDLLRILQD